jgi:DMSO reductase anchor subunit
VPLVYLLIGLLDGILIITFFAILFDLFVADLSWVIIVIAVFAGIVKLAYWRAADKPSGSTSATATGLSDGSESVALLDAPTTSENFVMREMGFRIARKHSLKLRKITFITLFFTPTAAATVILFSQTEAIILISSLVALAAAGLGTIVERWLFFAEAKHVVTLFYGRKSL